MLARRQGSSRGRTEAHLRHGHAPLSGHDRRRPESAGREARPQRALLQALGLTCVVLVVETAGGFLTGSLALLSDATHMLADAFALALALFAARFSGRRATPQRTFGYLRLEILAALANGVLLSVLAIFILKEAWLRMASPPAVAGGALLIYAGIGLLANLVSAVLLANASGGLNVQGALLHVTSDLLSSVGVLLGALGMLVSGARWIDPAIGFVIGIVILWSAQRLVRDAVDVLLESIPKGLDAPDVSRTMLETEGVIGLHDLHIWSLTTGVEALSAHVIVRPGDLPHADRILDAIGRTLLARYGIEHTTIQIESSPAEHVCFAERT